MQFCPFFPGAAKPGAPAESLGLAGKVSGLGSLGSEPGACLLLTLGVRTGESREQTVCDSLGLM